MGLRKWFQVMATAAILFTGQAAFAQGTGETRTEVVTPPAERMAISQGGVDMRTGQYAFSQTDVSIGDNNGLSFTRTQMVPVMAHANPFGFLAHNWHIMITERKVWIDQKKFEHNSAYLDYRMGVRWPGKTETFDSLHYNTGFAHQSRSMRASLTVAGDRASSGAIYTYEGADGTIMKFRPIGSQDCSTIVRCAYVSEKTDPDGTRFTFEYDNPGGQPDGTRLRSVVSSRGYALLLQYPSFGVQPSKACVLNLAYTLKPANNICPAGAPHSTYDGQSTTDASGETWTIGTGTNGTFGIIPPGQTVPSMVWGLSGRVDQEDATYFITDFQGFATGESYIYEYDSPPNFEGSTNVIAGGRYTDAAGNVTIVRYDFPRLPRSLGPDSPVTQPEVEGSFAGIQVTPGPVEIIDPIGRRWVMEYCDPIVADGLPPTDIIDRCVVNELVHFTNPEGDRVYPQYDGAGNLVRSERVAKPGSSLPSIIAQSTYACGSPKSCSKPATITDANGNVTNNTFSSVHGGILTSTLPPLPSGVRPQTRYGYAQRSVWIASAVGGYVQTGTPVWVLISESMCRTSAATGNPSAPCAGGASDEVRTLYDYGPDSGPNNLWLRGVAVVADGQTLRTCYQYDQLGRRIAETKPLGTGATCS
ncbi:MAG: hypothetical protein U1A73_24810 [Pseudomonas sp.]|nr:hypothetical protein [Pseudomonas sp.]